MNTSRHILGGLFLATATSLSLYASPEPDPLVGWSLYGAEKSTLTTTDGLNLPSGAQLYRPVESSNVLVRLVSTPIFAATADDLPVLEVGPAALVFLRRESVGRLILALESSAPLDLPFEFALDENGRSKEPLAITLGWQGSTVVVEVHLQTMHFPAGSSLGSREIMVSAGVGAAWPINTLEVEVVPAVGTELSDLEFYSAVKPSDQFSTSQRAQNNYLGEPILVGAEAKADSLLAEATSSAGMAGPVRQLSRGLELYTTNAVRLGRAAQVRAAVIGNHSYSTGGDSP
jgi:hypothetical protein